MASKKKQFKDYQDYLNSPEWKALKDEFKKNYTGLKNVCEISLTPAKKDIEFHHWRYPKNWNDDSIDNIIMVRAFVHREIHDSPKIKYNGLKKSRKSTIQILQRRYNSKRTSPLWSEIAVLKNKLSKVKEYIVNSCLILKED